MARLGVGRYSESLRRLLDMKGGLVALDELGPELQPSLVLENDRPEWLYLRGERRCAVSASRSAVAAERSSIRLANPGSSGILIVVEQIRAIEAVADAQLVLRLDNNPVNNVTAINGYLLDTRGAAAAAVGAGLVHSFTGTLAAMGGTTIAIVEPYEVAAFSSFLWDAPIILAPGRTIAMVSDRDDVTLTSTFIWRERALVQAEL